MSIPPPNDPYRGPHLPPHEVDPRSPYQPTNDRPQEHRPSTVVPEPSITDKAGAAAAPVKDQALESAGHVKDRAAEAAGQIKDEAASGAVEVRDNAAGHAQDLAGHAQHEVRRVGQEARSQIQGLVGETTDQLTHHASEQKGRLTETISGWTDELDRIQNGESTDGPVQALLGDLTSTAKNANQWLESREPGDIVQEVRRFAARRPTTFILAAAGLGFLGARLGRALVDESRSDSQVNRQVTSQTSRAQTSYAPQAPYQQTSYQQSPPASTYVPQAPAGGYVPGAEPFNRPGSARRPDAGGAL